jgi:hypothetical protein
MEKQILPIMQLSYTFSAKYAEDGGINIYKLRSSIFWGIMLCSLLKANLSVGFEGSHSSGLHSIISQKTELFITTAVRTSDPT